MSGGWSPVKPVTPDVTDICVKAKTDIEKKTGNKFAAYNPVSFASRILSQGTEYLVKVCVGDDECVHAEISAVLTSDGVKLTVLKVQYPKTLDDPLVPF